MPDKAFIQFWVPIFVAVVTPILAFIAAMMGTRSANKRNSDIIAAENRRHSEEINLRLDQFERQLGDNLQQRKMEVGRAILEKQLDAMQGAFTKWRELNLIEHDAHPGAKPELADLSPERRLELLFSRVNTVHAWYDANSYYLPQDIRKKFILVINELSPIVFDLVHDPTHVKSAEFGRDFRDTFLLIESKMQKFLDDYSLI